jgi:starch phosphorylase
MAHRRRFPYLPPRIEGLASLAMNISWSWSRNARTLFAAIDEPLWHFTRHNPIMVLRRVHPGASQCRRARSALPRDVRSPHAKARARAIESGHVVRQEHPDLVNRPIAYFCAEFGLHNSVPIYSGGLGRAGRRPL